MAALRQQSHEPLLAFVGRLLPRGFPGELEILPARRVKANDYVIGRLLQLVGRRVVTV